VVTGALLFALLLADAVAIVVLLALAAGRGAG
jgi:hypothetical protein